MDARRLDINLTAKAALCQPILDERSNQGDRQTFAVQTTKSFLFPPMPSPSEKYKGLSCLHANGRHSR